MASVVTCDTFDCFSIAHQKMVVRLVGLSDRRAVGNSTDEFNLGNGKYSGFITASCSHVRNEL